MLLDNIISKQQTSNTEKLAASMSYCIIRSSKLLKCRRAEERKEREDDDRRNLTNLQPAPITNEENDEARRRSSLFGQTPSRITQPNKIVELANNNNINSNTNDSHLFDQQRQFFAALKLEKMQKLLKGESSSERRVLAKCKRQRSLGGSTLLMLLLSCLLCASSNHNTQKEERVRHQLGEADNYYFSYNYYQIIREENSLMITLDRFLSVWNLFKAPQLIQLAQAQQYRPDWPSKSLQQEIFLLNLEDGYFGCQVNESQDFLQLFELSRLCDGQTQCYLGTDEMNANLRCNNRERCATQTNPRGQQEIIQCVNGVCLDGLCYCNDGFGGKSCETPDENECKYRPCDMFAHCTNTLGSYYCSCFPGYDGDGMHCQDINECEIPSLAALCSDNSECCNLPGHFVCKCKPGYQQSGQSQSSLTGAPSGNTTVLCTDIDECLDERACGRGASCENTPGSFRCSCPPGFTGDPSVECIDMDECRNQPCGIGAQCTNIPGGYRCSCAPGFERNPALPANLFGSTLSGLTTLVELAAATQTNQAPINSSIVACLDVNECAVKQGGTPICGIGAQCHNTEGAYYCQCPPNYTGNPKVACTDIDECAAHGCGPNAHCMNTPGSYKCECKPGYAGNAYSAEGCQDEDECLKKEACGLNAQCFNTLGSFQCTCQSGFTGDPYMKCLDIDECSAVGAAQNPCGPGAQCQNLEGGYRCACPEKYLARGTPEMGCERAAVDIGCLGDYDCTRNALCVNSTCQCKLGYQINGIDCVDVDECSLSQLANPLPDKTIKAFTKLQLQANNNLLLSSNSSSLCGLEATCSNTDGGYRCDCRQGYEKVDALSPISKCRDINECDQLTNVCGQNSRCFNTDGAFKCACTDGFIPIDPQEPTQGCKSPCDGVNCGQHATCRPHGEEAACVCKQGFTFDPNNIKLGCVDINECDTNYGPAGICGQRAICTNVPGNYRCHCPPGYSGDPQRYCEDINECDRRYGVFGQCGEMAVCNNTAGSYTCTCAQGFTGDPRVKCNDIDECSTKFGPNGRCGSGAICTNTPGKFSCKCPNNYIGDPQEGGRCVPEQPACNQSSDCATNQICQAGHCHCPFVQAQQQNQLDSNNNQQQSSECKHPCERTECGAHATCELDAENQALCVCDKGYMAPSDGRSGCVDVNECIQGPILSGMTPISAITSGRGGVAQGPSTVAPGSTTPPSANTTHPCGRNALCRNQPGSYDCVCPAGYSGNAYEACTLDVRNQQQQQQTLTTTTSTTNGAISTNSNTNNNNNSTHSNVFGNYQQEPRNTACSETCTRGQVCLEGQCVSRDSCRDSQDCRGSQSCEHVNQVLGFQCVNVCDFSQCGPEAKCKPVNHKPICYCNSSLGYAGDPYDMQVGCQLQLSFNEEKQRQQQQQTSTTSSNFDQQLSTLAGKHEQIDLHRTTVSGGSQNHHQGGDLSTLSVDFGLNQNQRQQQQQQQQQQQPQLLPILNTGTTSEMQSNNSTLEQLQRQQLQIFELQRDQTRRPNQPVIAYELPLPTTPILPQFSSSYNPQQQITTTTTTTTYSNQKQQQQQQQQQQNLGNLQQNSDQQKQLNEQLVLQLNPSENNAATPPSPQLNQTTTASKQQTSTTLSRQQQQSIHNLFSNKRKPPTLQQTNLPSNNNNQQQQQQQQQQLNRQDNINTNADLTQQKQQSTIEQRQKQQQADLDQKLQNQIVAHNEEIMQSFNQFTNKSAITTTTNYFFMQKQVACSNDQHCPGNLFCLEANSDHSLQLANQQQQHLELKGGSQQHHHYNNPKVCGCPSGYKREADYCFMQRVNCTSSSLCKAREECISSLVLQQYYSNSYQQQQGSQQFSLNTNDNINDFSSGICICPRGYKLTNSGIACIDRNECDEGTPCAVGAICQNKIGSYECVCPPGTIGEPYTKTCEPLIRQECATNSDCPSDRECDLQTHKCISPCRVCGPRANCTPANHVAICLCPPGYTGNAIDLVYGCQEPSPPYQQPTTMSTPISTTSSTTTSTTTSTSTTTARPSSSPSTTPVGVPFTTLLPTTTTTVAPFETTTPELVEFRTIPPSELFVMCLADGIQVEVQLGGFDGIIYVKGHSQDPKCRKLVMSSNANEFVDFKVQFGHCDLIHRDGEAGFVLVIQKHPKLVTYRARAYHVKCVYNTGERTVTLGFNVSMITTSGTIANTGPPPTCLMSITSLDGREVTSAEIGQDLLLRVDVQPDSIYGGFARSCEAKTMDDDGEYQYEVTDANGCATDSSIFTDWKYDQHRKSLVARFNAFKFPSSNNLRFQCNIRVCFGSCPAVNCNGIDAYGKRRRRREAPALIGDGAEAGDFSLNNTDSAEDTPADELIVTDAFKEGALREEIMVQSNAILTFDRKETSLPQQQKPPVEDIEFVCLPRLGIMMSIVLTTLLALLALAIATSCWCLAKRKRYTRSNGPLPHPADFPNPLLRSSSVSTLREPIYGP